MNHGVRYTYVRRGCRCAPCTTANTEYCRRQRKAISPDRIQHAQASSYKNYGCRCAPCTEAHSADLRTRRARYKGGAS